MLQPQRKAMDSLRKELQEEITHRNIPYLTRFSMFTWRMRFRIFLMVSIYAAFQYWGNLFAKMGAWLRKFYRKYQARWRQRFNPTSIIYQSAKDTCWKPERLQTESTLRLSAQFVRLDRELDNGFSRQLALDVLTQVSAYRFVTAWVDGADR